MCMWGGGGGGAGVIIVCMQVHMTGSSAGCFLSLFFLVLCKSVCLIVAVLPLPHSTPVS